MSRLGLLFGVDIEICCFCLQTGSWLETVSLVWRKWPSRSSLWSVSTGEWWRDLSSFTQSQSRIDQLQGHVNKRQPGDILSNPASLNSGTNKPRANSAPHLQTIYVQTHKFSLKDNDKQSQVTFFPFLCNLSRILFESLSFVEFFFYLLIDLLFLMITTNTDQ